FSFDVFRPLTRPSPFPYTTLFRSRLLVAPQDELERGIEAVALGHRGLDRELGHRQAQQSVRAEHEPVPVEQHAAARPDVEVADPDRKSTRLNSSHVKTSYAVFCLK